MAYEPHTRLTMLGHLGGVGVVSEIWSCTINLAPGNPSAFIDYFNIPAPEDYYEAWAASCENWFTDVPTGIRSNCFLDRIKVAHIGADGKYLRAAWEYDTTGLGGGDTLGPVHPFQVALAVTLGTDGDLGRVKGRFYIPGPGHEIDPVTGLISAASANATRDRTDQLLEELGNQPGLDAHDIRVVVASQGRKNSDGTVKIGPQNHDVQRVAVGRVLDTIRSRRSALVEGHGYNAVDQV